MATHLLASTVRNAQDNSPMAGAAFQLHAIAAAFGREKSSAGGELLPGLSFQVPCKPWGFNNAVPARSLGRSLLILSRRQIETPGRC